MSTFNLARCTTTLPSTDACCFVASYEDCSEAGPDPPHVVSNSAILPYATTTRSSTFKIMHTVSVANLIALVVTNNG